MNANAMPMENVEEIKNFALAGKAKLTLVSKKTGARFTFQVKKGKKKEAPHFVALLTGSNNEGDYTFMGTIFEQKNYRRGVASPIGPDAPSARAFSWAWEKVMAGELPPNCEVWHEGCCGKCGRTLTDPESIQVGLGPECRKMMKRAA